MLLLLLLYSVSKPDNSDIYLR